MFRFVSFYNKLNFLSIAYIVDNSHVCCFLKKQVFLKADDLGRYEYKNLFLQQNQFKMCDGIYVPSGVSFDPYAIRKLTSAFEYELKWHHYLYLQIFFLRLLMPEIMLMIYSSISFDTIKVFMEEEHRKLKKNF